MGYSVHASPFCVAVKDNLKDEQALEATKKDPTWYGPHNNGGVLLVAKVSVHFTRVWAFTAGCRCGPSLRLQG